MSRTEGFRNVRSAAVDNPVAVLGSWRDVCLQNGGGHGQVGFQRSPILSIDDLKVSSAIEWLKVSVTCAVTLKIMESVFPLSGKRQAVEHVSIVKGSQDMSRDSKNGKERATTPPKIRTRSGSHSSSTESGYAVLPYSLVARGQMFCVLMSEKPQRCRWGRREPYSSM